MPSRLVDTAPLLAAALSGTCQAERFSADQIRRETVWVTMRDGTRLATDLYLPPCEKAPVVVARTPYGKQHFKIALPFMEFAQRGYIAIAQDCRGTGDSEPDGWDYYVYEPEDGVDLVDWITKQPWFDGFIGACGPSYLAQTQWCMSLHPAMSAIAPEVSGLGYAIRTVHVYLFFNIFARSVGKGADKVALPLDVLEKNTWSETLAGGFYNEPLYRPLSAALLADYPVLQSLTPWEAQQWLWRHYASLPPAGRALLIQRAIGEPAVTASGMESLPSVFGHRISHDRHTIPHENPADLLKLLSAPALMISGWYDWGLDDTLETWAALTGSENPTFRDHSRLIITPSAHNAPGYHEGEGELPELRRPYRVQNNAGLLLHWYSVVKRCAFDEWPKVIYYLMGANEWHSASAWPPPESKPISLYLAPSARLTVEHPTQEDDSDTYIYDPADPTPTVGGSIISFVLPVGSVDVSEAQKRKDVLVYSTGPLSADLEVVGPIRLIVYVASSAVDTDFSARLSDVFPDGRAIQLQSAMLRTRYRNSAEEPSLMTPEEVCRLEIDMWATANRFRRGHRIRLDISSADFPRFDRNTNLGGREGLPCKAVQTVFRNRTHPSHLRLSILGNDIPL